MSDSKEIELETLVNYNADHPNVENEELLLAAEMKTLQACPRAGNSFKKMIHKLYCYCIKKMDILLLLLILFALVVLLTGCLVRLKLGSNGTQYVKNTIEYQIEKLAATSNITDRMGSVERWIKLFNENSELIELDMKNGEGLVRNQYSVSVHTCMIDTYIRVREYLTGSEAGKSTMDIKGNSKIQWRACNYPFWPALDYIGISYQKCEEDIHDECEHKYSRDTRIFFDSFQSYNVCSDVFKYYPFAGSDKSLSDAPVKPNEKENWWIYRYLGSFGTSDYEISFTLKYHELDDAMNETHPPFYGEWSIRITTLDHGFSDEWDEIFKADVEKAYHAIVVDMSEAEC